MKLKEFLSKQGIKVLSPVGSTAKNPNDEFVILDEDPISNPLLLQHSVFAKMRYSSFLVVCNVNGYLGAAALIEIGYAIAIGLKVLTLEPVVDPNIKPYCSSLQEYFDLMTG